jgi:hypothetical protein
LPWISSDAATMSTCHEHNLRAPLPGQRPFGIRVRLRRGDPFRNLVGDDWRREHWFETRAERERALAEMSGRYVYFRPGDEPALEFDRVDPQGA